MNNFFKQVFLVLGCFISLWASGQQNLNLVAPITINLPNNLSANTADWNSTVPPIIITAKAGTGGIQSWLLVTIKKGGSKICGSYTPETTPEANFNAQVKTWVGATVVELLGNSCTLSPGDYEFCVQFFAKDKRTLLGESSRPFTIKETKTQSYTPPTNLTPANEKTFTEKEAKAPITFRWTPVLPKPKDQVTYRLKVWQLMQGQNGTAAMKSNSPIVEKELKDFTQYVEPNILGEIEIINNSAKLIWNVEATRQNQTGEVQSLGISESTQFTLAASTCTCAALNCLKIVTYKNTITGVTKQVPNNIQTPIVLGCNVNYYFLDETVCNGVALEGCTKIVKGEFRNAAGDLIIQQTPFSLGSFFNIRSSTPGNYNFIIKYFIDDVECSTSTIPIVVSCSNELANFCPPQFGNIWVKRANGVQIETFDFINNINKTVIISPEYENCNEDLFLGSVNFCTDTCNKQEIYTLTNDATGDVITGVNSFKIPATLADGKYSLKVDLKCGDNICKTGTFGIKKSCTKNEVPNNPPNFCPPQFGNIWVKKANGTQIETFDFINNINKTVIISPEYENCNEDLFLGSVNFCLDTCNKQEIYTLKNNATSATITGVNVLKIPSSLPNGTYSLNVVLKCGNNICKEGDFTIIKNCMPENDCCKNASQIPPKIVSVTGAGQGILDCANQMPYRINGQNRNCKIPIIIKAASVCDANKPNCTGKVVFTLTNSIGAPIQNATNIITIPTTLPDGDYNLKINYYCGEKICTTYNKRIVKECKPNDTINCCVQSNWVIEPALYSKDNRLISKLDLKNPKVINISQAQNLCSADLAIYGKWACNTAAACSTSKVVYTLTNNITGSYIKSINRIDIPSTLENGNYTLKIEAYCGASVCKAYSFQLNKNCPQTSVCCVGGTWGDKTYQTNKGIIPLPKTGENLGIFKCNEIKSFKVCYNCAKNCDPAQIKYTIYKANSMVDVSSVSSKSCKAVNITMPTTAGNYQMTISATCGAVQCTGLDYYFTIECPIVDSTDCCKNASFKVSIVQDINENRLGNFGTCESPIVYAIADRFNNCNKDLFVKASSNCGSDTTNCKAKIVYTLSGSNTPTIVSTQILKIPASLPTGQYFLQIDYYCGNKICKSCKFEIKKQCPLPIDCCSKSTWGEKIFYKDGGVNGGLVPTPFPPAKVKTLVDFECKKDMQFKVCYNCPTGCSATIDYLIYNRNGLINSKLNTASCTNVIIPAPNYNDTFLLKIYAKCNGKICDSLNYFFKVSNCNTPKDCCKDADWQEMVEVFRDKKSNIEKKILLPECDSKLGEYNCNESKEFQVCFGCATSCDKAEIVYNIKQGKKIISTTSVKSCEKVSLKMPDTGGDYTLEIVAICGGMVCKTCTYTFSVANCNPPINCCKNATWKKAQYEIVNKKADGSWDYSDATLYNFSISRVAAIPTIKADVGVSIKNLLYQCFNVPGCNVEYIITRKNVTTGALEPEEKLAAGKNDASVYSKLYPQLITIQPLCGGQKCDKAIEFYLECVNKDCVLVTYDTSTSVKICDQIWMKRNLDVDRYRNGDIIPNITNLNAWCAATTGAWCYYSNDPANGAVYGKLYNWFAVNDSRGLAPQGWHVANNLEFTTLSTCLGGNSISGGKMKSAGFAFWQSPNTGATNSSGLTLLPGGTSGNSSDQFYYLGYIGIFWTSSQPFPNPNSNEEYPYSVDVNQYTSRFGIGNNQKLTGYSVRCIKD